MTKKTVIVVEDEEDIQELLRYNLEKEHYKVVSIESGEKAIKKVRSTIPDLILLDLMLPGLDGLEVCKALKGDSKTHHIPIIMLTAKGEEADIVTGLELGADDYITKPFSPRVLLARIKAVMRGKTVATNTEKTIKIHQFVINPGRREVIAGGKPVDLTYTEFQILHLLACRPGWVFARYKIVDNIRGDDYPVTDRSVDVQIASLRKKLGKYGSYIETVRGVGYRFKE